MADIKTVTDALRVDARMWDRQSAEMGRIRNAAEGLRVTRLEAGVFQVVFSAYEDAVSQISDRCAEGRDRMDEIASALIKSANAYDNREADTTKSIEGTY